MRRLFTFAVIVLTSAAAGAQAPAQPAPANPLTASIRGHMEFLAGDALNGRGSGTRDEWIAAEYIASNLRRWGLEPLGDGATFGPPDPSRPPRSFVQRIEMRAVETTAPPVITAGTLRLTHGKEMLVQTLGSVAKVSGPLVRYKAGTTVPTGAVLLMPAAAAPPVSPASMTPEQREAMAAERAATAPAALILSVETDAARAGWQEAAAKLPSAPPRAVALSAVAGMRPTRLFVDKASYAALAAQPANVLVSFDADTKWSDTASYTWNVVGQLTGSDEAMRRDVILLSAHLDHVGAGAAPADAKPDVDTI
jgi:hypothetical protein